MDIQALEQVFEQNRDTYLAHWQEALRFPSVSTEPAHDGDCRACAQWFVDHLRTLGFESRLLDTPSKPLVYAERSGAAGKPTVLFYGHYDVQPVDPIEAWESPPFEPTLRNGRLYARGAEDNKGQTLYALSAIHALIDGGAALPTLKIVIEGEEESGSSGITAALSRYRDLLQADVLMVTDVGTVASGAPTIHMGLRGIIHLTAVIEGPDHDLHSGSHGGVCVNPARAAAELVHSLHDADGRVAVKGFYDSVVDPSDRERELANQFPVERATYEAETGTVPDGGEPAFTPVERCGFRPTLEVNGIASGYSGPGIKTIIPAAATVKLTARLVPDQDPNVCLEAIARHCEAHTPAGVRLRIAEKGSAGPGFRLDLDSPLVQSAAQILRDVDGVDPAYRWGGGSIPVVAALSQVSGAEPLLIGFGYDADRAHAPNESFSIDQFRRGFLYVAHMLQSV